MDRKDRKDPMEAAAFSAAHGIRVTDSDDDLIRAARDGDYASFERLYEAHRNTVYRFAYQMTHSRDEAEDITQEAFVRAFQNLHRFREQAKFTTWILRIVTNLCTDRARMSTRRTNLEQKEATGGLEWMTIGKVVDPNEDMEEDRRAALVRKAVLALPTHHRNVILLRDFEEKEYTEIAEILGCTVGGAKLRVLRARRALRDRLEPLLRDQEPNRK
jgi:RNA polymerase sigma-70 factor (ECF subfamily)